MLTDATLEKLIRIFIGDTDNYYSYKTGNELVTFFNTEFGFEDYYQSGFPSRWVYALDCVKQMIEAGRGDDFWNLILDLDYIMKELNMSRVNAADVQNRILNEFNRLLAPDRCYITEVNGLYVLISEEEGLDLIGSGGFADVYYQKYSSHVVKKLRREFLADKGIRSRFKREFEITKSLQDLSGIIRIYEFDENNCQYTMELADSTLQDYIEKEELNFEEKEALAERILEIMSEVHKRDIIHRDLSPNNIFLCNGEVCIADFGLGKDLNVWSSHQTLLTNQVGQIRYCAPEQFMLLREGDKRSDVFSLGRIINYIFAESPVKSNHPYRSFTERATNDAAPYRFADAGQMLAFYRKSKKFNKDSENKERTLKKINSGQFDEEVEAYIYEMTNKDISRALNQRIIGFNKILLRFMNQDDQHALHCIQAVDDSYQSICGRSFKAYDPFAEFSRDVIQGGYPFVVKEIAAKILRFVAFDVNRFSAQRYIEEIINAGVDPMIEEELTT